ncbi:hypothetical protein [Shewanella sp.]|uniref:hypothetical protein n=1 Tax=Shewanella sp. TaxID=50422 RepID=UPI001EC04A70|nr:hypothetical protein [Shewanella sp.]NRB24177.1 hypothetical protein [Shewanella sp.]
MSINTTLYLAYSYVSNDAFSADGKGHGDKVVSGMGDDPSALSFGIIYKFDVILAN